MKPDRQVIALGSRLKDCRNVRTLGVRSNIFDYRPDEIEQIRRADKIYYPTPLFADLFDAMGKKTFPSYHTYKCVQDKIKQTALFALYGITHPRTRVFYGNRQKAKIGAYFRFPFIAKIPRGSAMGRGVYLVRDENELAAYNRLTTVAYIQEYLPIDRDIRVIVIGRRVVHGYWRLAPLGDFRSNVAVGATISLEPLPGGVADYALEVAMRCRWDDVGMDLCIHGGQIYVLEANMRYGREGFRVAGIDYVRLMEELIENGEI